MFHFFSKLLKGIWCQINNHRFDDWSLRKVPQFSPMPAPMDQGLFQGPAPMDTIIHRDHCHATLFEKHHKISLWYVYTHLLVINNMNNKWLSTMTKQITQNTCKTHLKNSCHSLAQVYLVDHFLHQTAMCHGQNMGLMGYGYPHRMGRKTSLLMAS